jgi:hypothetical protein
MVAKRSEQHMHMIGHDDHCMQTNARSEDPRLSAGGLCGRGDLCGAGALARDLLNPALPKPMLENYVPSLAREDTAADCAESNEKGGSGFLQVRQPAAIFVLGKKSGMVGHAESAWL